jgi:hypothetical protein
MPSHQVIALIGHLLFGMRDSSGGLTAAYKGFGWAFNLDNKITIVGTTDQKVRKVRANRFG